MTILAIILGVLALDGLLGVISDAVRNKRGDWEYPEL